MSKESLTERQKLLLMLLAEEACEVGQAASKCYRNGFDHVRKSAPGVSTAETLMEEIADVLVIVDSLVKEDVGIVMSEILKLKAKKTVERAARNGS